MEEKKSTELQLLQEQQKLQLASTPVGQIIKQFEVTQRMATMYAGATIIPTTYQKSIPNCAIAIEMAMRMQANPLMVMQNLYIVHGNPAFSSKFLIATINTSKKFTPLRYEFVGTEGKDDYACRCYAYEINDVEHIERLEGDWVSIAMAKAEGWYAKSGSKWKTMPGQMLRYRAAAFWQRVYCPEISMGLMTKEEYEDIQDVPYTEVKTTDASIDMLMRSAKGELDNEKQQAETQVEEVAEAEQAEEVTEEVKSDDGSLFA